MKKVKCEEAVHPHISTKNAPKDIILNTKNEIFGEISQLPKSKGKTQNGKFVQFAKNLNKQATKFILCHNLGLFALFVQ